jgi:hypothetical protein
MSAVVLKTCIKMTKNRPLTTEIVIELVSRIFTVRDLRESILDEND